MRKTGKRNNMRRRWKKRSRIALFSLMLLLFVTFGAINSFAGSKNLAQDPSASKCYTSVLIYPGDTIESISEQYIYAGSGDTASLAKEILSINHLSPDKALQPGNHIIVPVYKV